MIEVSQFRAGYGDFMHVSPPSEKIPSPAARSGYTPESVIFCGWAHGSPVPYQAVIVAYTEFTFRSPSGSETCAKTKKPSPDWTGSIAVDEYSPSAHLSTNTGGRDPAGGVSGADHRTMLFSVSTIVIVIESVDRRVKFLYPHRSPTFQIVSVPSMIPLGVARSLLYRCSRCTSVFAGFVPRCDVT